MEKMKRISLAFLGIVICSLQYAEVANAATVIKKTTSSGAVLETETTYSDGSSIYTYFDPDNIYEYTKKIMGYSSTKHLDYIDSTFDDQSRTVTYLRGARTSEDWFLIYRYYNTEGHLEHQQIQYKNSSKLTSNWDTKNEQPWSYFSQMIRNQVNDGQSIGGGQIDYEYFEMDDGTKKMEKYDYQQKEAWNKLIQIFDGLGREDSRDYRMDSGNRVYIDLDQSNSQPWTTVMRTFDLQGREDTREYRMDNGTRVVFDFDQASQMSWSMVRKEYSSAGVLTSQIYTNDDGTVTK